MTGRAGADGGGVHVRLATRSWGVAEDGVAIEVVVPRPVEHLLEERWPPIGLTATTEAPALIRKQLAMTIDFVTGDHDLRVDGEPSSGRWERIESELALFTAERLTGLVAVHAAVIVHGDRAIVVPGPSGTGKSTLCLAAVDVGARVLSDEYALVDPASGFVAGWQRPVRVRLEGGGVERRDITVASEPVPVGLIAVIGFDRVAAPTLSPISSAEAVIELMSNTICARSRPDESLDAAVAVARSARAVKGARGEASGSISELLDLIDR